MKKYLSLLMLPALLFVSSCIEQDIPANAPETVESVDVARYMGLWYEIDAYDQWFTNGCECVTAEYELLPTGNVKVTNRCKLFNGNGPESRVVGSAVPVPGTNATRLTVSFAGPNNGSENGNYWIIELDEDYTYAVVSDPFRTSWYLLSRTPIMDEAQRQEIIDRAVDNGFVRNRIKKTKQDCG